MLRDINTEQFLLPFQLLSQDNVQSVLIPKAKSKLDEASGVIESASSKTRSIEKKFQKVQRIEMPDRDNLAKDDLQSQN